MDAIVPTPYSCGKPVQPVWMPRSVLLCSAAKFDLGQSSAELQRSGNGDGWYVDLGAERYSSCLLLRALATG